MIHGSSFEHVVALIIHAYAEAGEARVTPTDPQQRSRSGSHSPAPGRRGAGHQGQAADRVKDTDAKHLHWRRDRIGEDLIDAVAICAASMPVVDVTTLPSSRWHWSARDAGPGLINGFSVYVHVGPQQTPTLNR
jgi:hypothetical protein